MGAALRAGVADAIAFASDRDGDFVKLVAGEMRKVLEVPDQGMPGITARKKSPSTTELRMTRTNDNPAIGPKSRRNSMAGRDTAAE